MATALEMARHYKMLSLEIVMQLLTGTAYDGSTHPFPSTGMFSEADGSGVYSSSTRYGSSSGNIVSVSSTSTVQGVITDIFSSHRRLTEFLNTQTRPYHDPLATKKLSVLHGSATTQVMNAAYFQTRVPWEQTAGANGTGQTPTNLLREGGFELNFVHCSTYISDSKYYLFMRGIEPYKRPIWCTRRKGYEQWQATFITSDHTRDTGQVYIQGDCREGYGGALAISTVSVQ